MSETAQIGCPSGLAPPGARDGAIDPSPFVRARRNNGKSLELAVTGARCAGCLGKIERSVGELPGVTSARLNLSTGKLAVEWQGTLPPAQIVMTLTELGYGVTPYDPTQAEEQVDEEGRRLLRCLAVAGFGTANIMLLSIAVWASTDGEMGEATRRLMHLISALIAIPTVAFAGRPFFSSAWAALRNRRANMDVPISLAICLAVGVSLFETFNGGHEAYFDAAVMLPFFLLIGRWLDHYLRNRARSAARDLLALQAVTSTLITADGGEQAVAARDIRPGDHLRLRPGDRVPVDATILNGTSDINNALLTGESVPVVTGPGETLSAGAINLSQPLEIRAKADVANSFVAELIRLVEIGQQAKGRFTVLADKAARAYVPIVHTLAAFTLLGWWVIGGDLRPAIMAATATLIITCPCALGLATPAVQVVATGQLFRRQILVKSGDALERLAAIKHVVFDKTGTLTRGELAWQNREAVSDEALLALGALARASRHPVARAIVGTLGGGDLARDVTEVPGKGVSGYVNGTKVWLGRASFLGITDDLDEPVGPTAWFRVGETGSPIRLEFADALRPEAASVVSALKGLGLHVSILSGDRESTVATIAEEAGIDHWRAGVSPAEKAEFVAALAKEGPVAMVGDGINDAPALAHASVSLSPGSAADAAQSAADFVFGGDDLSKIVTAYRMAGRTRMFILQNFGFAALYNAVAAPLAMAGFVTPLIAALAMSGSSLVVTLNALRLGQKKV